MALLFFIVRKKKRWSFERAATARSLSLAATPTPTLTTKDKKNTRCIAVLSGLFFLCAFTGRAQNVCSEPCEVIQEACELLHQRRFFFSRRNSFRSKKKRQGRGQPLDRFFFEASAKKTSHKQTQKKLTTASGASARHGRARAERLRHGSGLHRGRERRRFS